MLNWYQREEMAVRIAYLFGMVTIILFIPYPTLTPATGASALAGAFGGLLAFAILHLDGVAGMAGWRWYVWIPRLRMDDGFRIDKY